MVLIATLWHVEAGPPPPQDHIPCMPLPSAAPIRACYLNSLSRNKPCVESQCYSRDGVMNGIIHPGCPRVTINVGIISPSGWIPWLILVSYYLWNVSWLAVEEPHTTKNVNGIRMMSYNQVTPSWLRGYWDSLLLSGLRLPPLGQQLWTDASTIRADVGCRPPRRLGKPPKEWKISILPWNHALWGGGGICCVWKTSPCDTYNRRLGHILVLPSASSTPAHVNYVSNNGWTYLEGPSQGSLASCS
jgi:hypothetical protein